MLLAKTMLSNIVSEDITIALSSFTTIIYDEIAGEISRRANAYGRRNVRVVVHQQGRRNAGVMLDNTKLVGLGWKLTTSLADGIGQVFDSYVE